MQVRFLSDAFASLVGEKGKGYSNMFKKEFFTRLRDNILKHARIIIPVVAILLIAFVVSFALKLRRDKQVKEQEAALLAEQEQAEETVQIDVDQPIPLVANEDQDIASLIYTYYNAMGIGDEVTLNSTCDYISEQEMIRYLEMSKYIDHYTNIEIYTMPGPEEGSSIAFVYFKVILTGHEDEIPAYKAYYICKNENGELYIKRSDNTDEDDEFIRKEMLQDEVIDFNNRVTVEYNELMSEKPELLKYLSEIDSEVNTEVGEALASMAAEEANEEEVNTEEEVANAEEAIANAEADKVKYATANTTVNVRSSDSENADKLGKVTGGTTLEIREVKENGWTEVVYNGNSGFIKSEYLSFIENAEGQVASGKVKATTTINVRSQASTTADRIGVLATGETVESISNDNGWWKVIYQGKIGYVKEDYVESVAE
ncbi:MAG: SH3 domain-containing protein [Acetatifactor sp.]|nr:SH3 domain-containing protein [Acetatifactor sp.]